MRYIFVLIILFMTGGMGFILIKSMSGDAFNYGFSKGWRKGYDAGYSLGTQEDPIIRCKECRHWYVDKSPDGTITYTNRCRCLKGQGGNGLDFYCGYAERKD